MNKVRLGKGWRKVAAWALATTLAFGLMPNVAFANTEEKGTLEFNANAIAPTQGLSQELVEPKKNADGLGALANANTIPQAEITAKLSGSLAANEKTTISAAPYTTQYYTITLSKPSKLSLIFTELNTEEGLSNYKPNISLYALRSATKTAYLFAGNIDSAAATGSTSFAQYWYLTKGIYYLEVQNSYSSSDTFSVQTKTVAYAETYAEPIPGTNETYNKAKTISFGKPIQGLVATYNLPHHIDEVDFYKFYLPYDTSITIKSSAVAGLKGSALRIYNKAGVYQGSVKIGYTYTNINLAKGTYCLCIEDLSAPYNGGKYTVTVTKGPKMVPTFPYKNKPVVKLKWSAVAGADKYQIWRSNYADKGFKLVKSVNASTRSYSATLPVGKHYFYKIRVVDGGKVGAWSTTWEVYFRYM